MSDDLERRLREAFEAKASQVTPEMLDIGREHQLGEDLAASRRRRRRSVFAGLGGVAAAAAAIAVAVVVTDTPATPRPVIAVTQHTTQSSPASHSSAPLPSHPKTREAEPPAPSHAPTTPPAPPVTTTSSAPPPPPTSTTSSPSTPVESSTTEQTPSTPRTAPSAPTMAPSSPTVESVANGNYPLTGTLRQAAGVDFLPLPAEPSTTVVDQTGRTTRLSTSDCAAIRSYWETAMPENGWKRAPRAGKDMWFAPTGDAWAFTDASSGACTIQISAGP